MTVCLSYCRLTYPPVDSVSCGERLLVNYMYKQVAQLWQRDHVKLEMFSINVHRYSQNHAQNCIFVPLYVRIGDNVSGFNAKKTL